MESKRRQREEARLRTALNNAKNRQLRVEQNYDIVSHRSHLTGTGAGQVRMLECVHACARASIISGVSQKDTILRRHCREIQDRCSFASTHPLRLRLCHFCTRCPRKALGSLHPLFCSFESLSSIKKEKIISTACGFSSPKSRPQ